MGEAKLNLTQFQSLVEEQNRVIAELKLELNNQQALIETLKNENTSLKEKNFPTLPRQTTSASTPRSTKDATNQKAKRPHTEIVSSNENSFTEQDKTASTPALKKSEKPPPITIHSVENSKT
jgi:hypothetical protein